MITLQRATIPAIQIRRPSSNRIRVAWFIFLLALATNVAHLLPSAGNATEKGLLLIVAGVLLSSSGFHRIQVFLVSTIAVLILLFGLVSQYPGSDFLKVLRATISLVALLLPLCLRDDDGTAELLTGSLALLPIFMLAVGAVYAAIGLWPFLYNDATGTNRLTGGTFPAYYAAVCYSGVVAAALRARSWSSAWNFLALANIVLCLATASRMPAALAAASFILIWLSSFRHHFTKLLLLPYIAALGSASVYFGASGLVRRLMDGTNSGRDLIWQPLLQAIQKYPITGVGFGNHSEFVPLIVTKMTGTATAHNEYIRIALELGYVGAAIFLLVFFTFLIFLYKNLFRQKRWLFWPLITLFLVFGATDNSLLATQCFLPLFAIAFGLQFATKSKIG